MISDYEFDKNKSEMLRDERGVGFEEVIPLIEAGSVIATYPHPNSEKYPGQHVHAVSINGYVWLVIFERRNDKIRLVTLYKSRKATKQWLKEFNNG